jgi:hypothetical protein
MMRLYAGVIGKTEKDFSRINVAAGFLLKCRQGLFEMPNVFCAA